MSRSILHWEGRGGSIQERFGWSFYFRGRTHNLKFYKNMYKYVNYGGGVENYLYICNTNTNGKHLPWTKTIIHYNSLI